MGAPSALSDTGLSDGTDLHMWWALGWMVDLCGGQRPTRDEFRGEEVSRLAELVV